MLRQVRLDVAEKLLLLYVLFELADVIPRVILQSTWWSRLYDTRTKNHEAKQEQGPRTQNLNHFSGLAALIHSKTDPKTNNSSPKGVLLRCDQSLEPEQRSRTVTVIFAWVHFCKQAAVEGRRARRERYVLGYDLFFVRNRCGNASHIYINS